MKEELESVVLQMYRDGLQCCEAVREFQSVKPPGAILGLQ